LVRLSRRQLVLLSILLTWLALEIAGARPFALDFERSGWEGTPGLVLRSEVRGLVTQTTTDERLLATRSDHLYVSANGGVDWSHRGQLEPRDYSRLESWASALRCTWLGRALWPGRPPRAILQLRSGALLAHHPPWIQRSVDEGRKWKRVGEVSPSVDSVGLHGLVEEREGRVWALPGEADFHLLRSDKDGRSWDEVVLTLAAGPEEAVRPGRVASIQLDPLRERLWLTTAGEGEQVQIGWLEGDGSFRAIAVGKEEFTAGSLMFTADFVTWASDAAKGPWGIWRWARLDEQIEQVAELPGPARSSTVLADGTLLVATRVVAPGSPNLEIWTSVDGSEWTSLLRLRGGRLGGFTSPEVVIFPSGARAERLVFTVAGAASSAPAMILADWVR
jgi:hypothetical protein